MGCGCNKKSSSAGLNVGANPNALGLGTGGENGVARSAVGTRKLAGIPLIQNRNSSDTSAVLNDLIGQTNVPVVKSKSNYNLLDVIKDKFSGNMEYANDDTQRLRNEQCNNCSHKVAGVCTQCGCVIQMKVRYANSSCPLNKW